jgi:carbonic anhydrase/acetyltransferase-like protein (isoleucine patch superfamily)
LSDRARDWPARLRLDATAFIAPGAVVVGEVTLGARSSVWFHTVVRGDSAAIEVGEETNLQDHTTIHVDEGRPARIGARVTVGHRAIVHGCTIGEECLIGMGSVVLSGARIGAGSLIGAAALVREGQVIPPGSLAVGAPARVVGAVGEEHRAAIARGAAHYVELSRSYLARGFARPRPVREPDLGMLPQEHQPMRFSEWEALLAALDHAPERVARWVAPDRRSEEASPLELASHFAGIDRDVRLPFLQGLRGSPSLPVVAGDAAGARSADAEAGATASAGVALWRAERTALLRALRAFGPEDWGRLVLDELRGLTTLGGVVRDWVDRDLEAMWRVERALETSA